jgi:pyridoxamine 5'-phosphate oxidase
MSLADLRKDYARAALDEHDARPDPIEQFRAWLDDALRSQLPEPNAMTLATAAPDGRPSARIVLLRGVDQRGFAFFTNRNSRKGGEMQANPWASLVFYWSELERQVRVEGPIERVDDAESDAYFASRPRGSQLAAWASDQSELLANRSVLEERFRDASARFEGGPVPRPLYWGGYRVVPESLEFWQGRPSRMHDRLRYVRRAAGGWDLRRLSP